MAKLRYRVELFLSLLLLLAVLAVWWMRGPHITRLDIAIDMVPVYAPAKLFFEGKDPYSERLTYLTWVDAAGLPRGYYARADEIRSVYPPTALPFFLPFTLFDWRGALRAYQIVCCVALPLMILILLRGNTGPRSDRLARHRLPLTIAFFALMLGFSSFNTGSRQGNLSLLVVELLIASYLLHRRGHPWLTGFLLAAAVCLKPPLSLGILIYFLIRRSWKTLFTCAAVCVVSTIVSMAWLHFKAPEFLQSYRGNVSFMQANGGPNDFAVNDEMRFDMVNLQVPAYTMTHNRTIANFTAFTVSAVLLGFWLRLRHRKMDSDADLGYFAALCAISLLPVYERNYNLPILILALAWAYRSLPARRAIAIVALCVPFLVPLEASLRSAALPPSGELLFQKMWFQVIVLCNCTWAVLLIAILLLAHLSSRDTAAYAPPEAAV